MLQQIRDKSQGWIAKVIIGIIVLLFALTGFDAIFRAVSHDSDVAVVNGEGITRQEFSSVLEQQKYRLRATGEFDDSPEMTTKLNKLVVDNLVNYRILMQAAQNAGFGYLPEAFITQSIQYNPLYQTNGQFDYNLFEQDIRSVGYASDKQFVNDQLEQRFLQQLQSGISLPAIATDDDVMRLASLFEQTRDFAYYPIDASKITSVSDEEIKTWYESHKDTLKTPEQVVLEYVELNRDKFLDKVTISDEELKALYTKKVVDLDKAAVRQRIAHILIPVTAKITDEQAKAKVAEIAAELKQGKDFAALAKQYSQDTGTANKGGDLGFVTDEELPDPIAFASALQSLDKVGDVSEPVRSQFGWHLIKLTDKQKAVIPSFESQRQSLAEELKQQKAFELYLAEQKRLDSAAFENFDGLDQVAKDFDLTLKTTQPFGKNEGYDAVTASNKVVKEAFSPSLIEDKENSSIIEVSPNLSVIIRVKEHLQPSVMTIEQATPIIKKQLQADKAKLEGERLIAELKAGKVDTVINGEHWKELKNVKHPIQNDPNAGEVDAEVIETVFSTPKPVDEKGQASGIALQNGNYVVTYLTKVNDFKGPLSDEDKAKYQQLATVTSGNKLWDEYQKYLQEKAEIKYIDQ